MTGKDFRPFEMARIGSRSQWRRATCGAGSLLCKKLVVVAAVIDCQIFNDQIMLSIDYGSRFGARQLLTHALPSSASRLSISRLDCVLANPCTIHQYG